MIDRARAGEWPVTTPVVLREGETSYNPSDPPHPISGPCLLTYLALDSGALVVIGGRS